MRSRFARVLLISTCLRVGAAVPAMAAYEAPTVVTDAATGNVTVTLSDGSTVLVSAALAAQIVAARKSRGRGAGSTNRCRDERRRRGRGDRRNQGSSGGQRGQRSEHGDSDLYPRGLVDD